MPPEMIEMNSSLYEGRVFHQRYRPRKHRLNYRVFSLLVDLDELAELDKACKLFSYNRFNFLSIWDRDFGAGDGQRLRGYIDGVLSGAGINLTGGSVRLLCYPRLFGYVFNPLSVYYCYAASGGLKAVLYEVSNTFKERHGYLIEVDAPSGGTIRQTCNKAFYVSPFMDMDAAYRFRLSPPDEKISVLIDQIDDQGIMLKASFTGRARPFADGAIARMILKYPLMTVKVIAGIHWEALKLWRKGIKLFDRPPPPAYPITHIETRSLEPRP